MAELLGYDTLLHTLECPDIPATLRTRWLWELDLKEEVSAKQMLNEAHLTGLVLCRVAGLQQPDICGVPGDLIGRAVVIPTPYQSMTMRELHDSVEHSQMHMQPLLMGEISGPNFKEHLERLFARLGHLLLPLKSTPGFIFDDPDSLEVATDGTVTRVMTSNILRWFLNVFVILFRHIELRHCAEPPVLVGPRLELKEFHIEAATDDFYKYSQYFDLPPAAALQYSCDFGLMLNSVTQITYFCFPDYERRRQISFEEVSSGEHAIYALAAVLSMIPSVTILLEDGGFGAAPGAIGDPAHAKAGWRVVLGAGSIYLLDPTGRLFCDENVVDLMRAVPIPGSI
ncbi:hypothetical protein T484DRAFT_3633375 [Baffinella frigidus]|nr:hypothetical protein T484DRAFT_3633375 [Cryptophyta sp. CCMP2293]